MKNVAVYIRVSTDDQAEYSPESQLQEVMAFAKRNDYMITKDHIYTDSGISGRSASKRPEFTRMIAEAKTKPTPFEAVLVWKFSRFARNQEESILYKSLLKKECGVDVISVTEETGDSVFGSLIERIIEWMDEFYSIRLSQEVKTKMTMIAKKGVVQTIASYGYKKESGKPMEIVEDESKWVQYMFESYNAGKSLLQIARTLNDANVRTHRGSLFEGRTIQYILYNPIYKGYTRWTPTGKTVGKRVFDDPNTIIAKGDFEPIVSEELFDSVQEKLAQETRGRHKNDKPTDMKKHWLAGIVKCSSCGSSLTVSQKLGSFQCWKYGKGICKKSHAISIKKLENAFFEGLSKVTVTEEFIQENVQIQEITVDYTSVINKNKKILERAKTAYLEGLYTLEEYREVKNKFDTEIKLINEKIEEEKKKVELPSVDDVKKRFSDVKSLLLSDLPVKDKQDALRTIIDKVVYSKEPETLDIFFKL